MVNQDRNVFAACMVATGDADAHGHRPDPQLLDAPATISCACSTPSRASGCSACRSWWRARRTLFIADTLVHELPDARGAGRHRRADRRPGARSSGHEPRVALLSYSNFGNPHARDVRAHPRCARRSAVLDRRKVDFEYDGEMQARRRAQLRADARALSLLPALRAGQRAGHAGAALGQHLAKLLQQLGGGTLIGPLLIGLSKPAQIVPARRHGAGDGDCRGASAAHDAMR